MLQYNKLNVHIFNQIRISCKCINDIFPRLLCTAVTGVQAAPGQHEPRMTKLASRQADPQTMHEEEDDTG